MGLDMYIYAVPSENIDGEGEVDFIDHTYEKECLGSEFDLEVYYRYADTYQVAYFRKHDRLHNWMRGLYYSKHGTDIDFNGDNVRLTLEDLRLLSVTNKFNKFEDASGFFWGDQKVDNTIKRQYNEVIRKCREAIKDGKFVYYTSSW